MPSPSRVAVVGGGIIGLSVAWRLAERGHAVTLWEQGELGRGASWAAAGMLAPAAEIGFEELDLYALGRESLRRWRAFATNLETTSGISVDYDDGGTLVVADDRDAVAALRRLHQFQQDHGVPVEWLTTEEALEREPLLSPRLPAAIWSPEDHQVDNRAVVAALAAAVRRAGVRVREGVKVRSIAPGVLPAITIHGGASVTADVVVLAAGAWSRDVGGLTPSPPVRPVRGEALSLRMTESLRLRRVVRGPDAYLAPKTGNRLVIGATSEERGFDRRVTAGGIFRLLEGAVKVVPAVEELELIETWAGLRPSARDHAPILGRAAPGVVMATGHYRHGVLLTPVTADAVAEVVEAVLAGSPETPQILRPFSPHRF